MTIQNISKSILLLCIFTLFPVVSYGYYTTSQSAQLLTPHTALYTIDFTFGSPKRDIYIPIATKRDLHFNDKEVKNVLGYTLHTSADDTLTTTAGIVLSTQPIENGMYKIPAGTQGSFTLVVLQTRALIQSATNYALQVSKLPFPVIYPDGTQEYFELNPTELERYTTPTITF